ncbi:MAG: hypothetical protein ABR975_15425 [Vulcanimicrobiaceae bacterium]
MILAEMLIAGSTVRVAVGILGVQADRCRVIGDRGAFVVFGLEGEGPIIERAVPVVGAEAAGQEARAGGDDLPWRRGLTLAVVLVVARRGRTRDRREDGDPEEKSEYPHGRAVRPRRGLVLPSGG